MMSANQLWARLEERVTEMSGRDYSGQEQRLEQVLDLLDQVTLEANSADRGEEEPGGGFVSSRDLDLAERHSWAEEDLEDIKREARQDGGW